MNKKLLSGMQAADESLGPDGMPMAFHPGRHHVNVPCTAYEVMVDDDGAVLHGIRGQSGARGTLGDGTAMGGDLISMEPGSAFPLHTHDGAHILYGVSGIGLIHVDGTDYTIRPGDTVFVPAAYAHGVKSIQDATETFRLLAIGYPHKHVTARDRMHIVRDEGQGLSGGSSRRKAAATDQPG